MPKIWLRLQLNFPYPPHLCVPQIEVMSHHAQAMLAVSLVALADLDAQAGQAVKRLDDTVDTTYKTLYQTLATERDIKGVVEPIILLALAIRHLERMADHATNMGQLSCLLLQVKGFKVFEFYTGVVNITDWSLLVIARLLE